MEATTAFALVLAGLALWFSCFRRLRILATSLALLVGLLGFLTLAEYATGVDLGLGALVIAPLSTAAAGEFPGRMSVATAACFVLVALGVLAMRSERSPIAGLASILLGVVAGFAAVGYAYDPRGLYRVSAFSTMALNTSLAFVLLAVGLPFTRPGHGLVGFANRDGVGSAMVRRLVPWAVTLPVVTGWLVLTGERAGLYPMRIGTGLLALAMVGLLVAVITWTAHGLAAEENRRDREREQAEGRFRVAVEASPSGMLMVDGEGAIVLANSETVRMFGYAADELLGRPVDELVPGLLHEEHLGRREAFQESPSARQTAAGRAPFGLRKDGSEFPLEIALNPVPTAEGVMVLGSIVDITERRNQEKERENLQKQLLQAQKLESVGRLAGGVAHDFNNILGVLGGYAELLRDGLGGDPTLTAHADEILRAVERASGLTRQLLAFSRQQVLQLTVLDLNDVVRRMEGMLVRLLGADIDLVTLLENSAGSVRADSGQMEQVLMNLVINARDAMPRGGRLTVETSNVDLDESYASLHPEVTPGPYVQLSVSDTGVGMDAETLQQVFDPFFTTKPVGRGTGLGLATVHGIVRQSGGHVYVYSELGKGSTFKVYLPVAGEAPQRQLAASREVPATGSETILVAEDEEALCALVRTGLEAYGYTVLTAFHGRAARAICETYDGPIDLLLTDVVMPDVGGRQLAAELTSQRPRLKVLYMSGYTDDTIVRHGIVDGRVPYVQKPFSLTALARHVREALDRPAGNV